MLAGTARVHVRNIFRTLEVNNRTAAVFVGIRLGYILYPADNDPLAVAPAPGRPEEAVEALHGGPDDHKSDPSGAYLAPPPCHG